MTRQRFELALSSNALLNFFSFETAENLDLLERNGKQIMRLIQRKMPMAAYRVARFV